jgi:serine/threonine protein kinase
MAEEVTEADQRKMLEQNGWVPTGAPLGEGGGARVFKVVPMAMIQRIAETFLLPADMDTAKKRALPAAELIAGAVSGGEILVAAGKVTKHPDERLKREIEILADVQHPHLIRMLAHDKSSAPTWYVMPVMKGVLKERKDFKGNVLGVLRGMLDVARALSALHHHPKRIVHRDIKPGNIFMTDDGRWILGDPGVAYRDDGKDMTTTRVWSKDWAPTWPDDKLCQSPKSDLYMLGATGLAVLVGEKPLNPTLLKVHWPLGDAQTRPAGVTAFILLPPITAIVAMWLLAISAVYEVAQACRRVAGTRAGTHHGAPRAA